MKVRISILFSLLLLGIAPTAMAYVGPGAGLSLLGALWGLLLAIGAAIAFIIFWPLRRLRHRSRTQKKVNKANRHART